MGILCVEKEVEERRRLEERAKQGETNNLSSRYRTDWEPMFGSRESSLRAV